MAPSQVDSVSRQARRSNHVSALAVGLVLLLGAGWYYLSAAQRFENFRQEQLSAVLRTISLDQTDAVMVNFPHLFNFLPVAASAGNAVTRNAADAREDCSAAAVTADGAPLQHYLQCQLVSGAARNAERDAAVREALATRQPGAQDHRDNESVTDVRCRAIARWPIFSMRWVEFADSAHGVGSGDTRCQRPAFRFDRRRAGKRELVVTDCRVMVSRRPRADACRARTCLSARCSTRPV
ncbi:MAG: hypothetical protein IPG43_24170 [Proteobacteria bacterium]|nr:hypothetical protein [Pseudomonadota bacterium]